VRSVVAHLEGGVAIVGGVVGIGAGAAWCLALLHDARRTVGNDKIVAHFCTWSLCTTLPTCNSAERLHAFEGSRTGRRWETAGPGQRFELRELDHVDDRVGVSEVHVVALQRECV
jgi:hypothetical protein